MIEAIVNSEIRKANLKLDGDGLTLFVAPIKNSEQIAINPAFKKFM